jgi:hypothetical protein
MKSNWDDLLKITLLVILVLFPSFLLADWQSFNPGPFSVILPGPPRKVGGNLVWVATDHQKRAYNVTCKRLEDFQISPKDYFSQTIEDVAEGLHGQLDYQKLLKFQGNEACEFKITTPKHVVVGRLILTKPYLYSLEVSAGSNDYDSGMAGKFFDSLKLSSNKTLFIPEQTNKEQPATQPW